MSAPRRRISPNNPVRRRLFSEDTEESRDNFANIVKESITNDTVQFTKKWNFDSKNGVPLEGKINWYRPVDGIYDWIGVVSETHIDANNEEDKFFPMKKENEVTPKSKKNEESAPPLRKRQHDVNSSSDTAVKRRISFDE